LRQAANGLNLQGKYKAFEDIIDKSKSSNTEKKNELKNILSERIKELDDKLNGDEGIIHNIKEKRVSALTKILSAIQMSNNINNFLNMTFETARITSENVDDIEEFNAYHKGAVDYLDRGDLLPPNHKGKIGNFSGGNLKNTQINNGTQQQVQNIFNGLNAGTGDIKEKQKECREYEENLFSQEFEVKKSFTENLDDKSMRLKEWLITIGLVQYFEIFMVKEVDDLDTVMKLNDGDLRELGVEIGSRKKNHIKHTKVDQSKF